MFARVIVILLKLVGYFEIDIRFGDGASAIKKLVSVLPLEFNQGLPLGRPVGLPAPFGQLLLPVIVPLLGGWGPCTKSQARNLPC